MVEYNLTASSVLNRLPQAQDDMRIEEVTGRFLYALACNPVAAKMLAGKLETYGLHLPAIGRLASGEDFHLFSSGRDQWILSSPQEHPEMLSQLKLALVDSLAVTDQSDAWIQLRLSGPGVFPWLARLSMLDLHEESFPVGAVARTVMEHLGVMIIREDEEVFQLLGARSFAHSFTHFFA